MFNQLAESSGIPLPNLRSRPKAPEKPPWSNTQTQCCCEKSSTLRLLRLGLSTVLFRIDLRVYQIFELAPFQHTHELLLV